MNYLGDFVENSTVYIFFSTNNGEGARVDFDATIELDDFLLYKNGSIVERSSTNGWTLTQNFDGKIGIHLLAIDLSDNTDTGFYSKAQQYTLILYPNEQIDGVTVSKVLAQFSIEHHNDNLNHIEGLSLSGNNATLRLKQLNVLNNAGDAIYAQSSGSNGSGLHVIGFGTGNGITATKGASGKDIDAEEFATSLSDIGLDHLLFTSVSGSDVADNSIIAQLVSKSATADWNDYDNTTDSLQALSDNTSSSLWTTIEKANIRHALGVDGTKTAPTLGFGRLGDPSAFTDIATGVGAIKTKTDGMNFTGANLDVNLKTVEGSTTVDGLSLTTMFENFISALQGDVSRSGNTYTFLKQDGITPAFSFTTSAGGRS